MQALIFPFLYCLLLGSAWSVLSGRKFADSLAPALMLHMIVAMLCGMVFHNLSVGIYGGIAFFAAVLVWRLVQKRQDVRALVHLLWNDGLSVFFLLYLFCFFSNYGKEFTAWDEFGHWGMFLKESLRLDMLYTESPLPLFHKDYVPATTLFEVIWCRLSGRFVEADAYRAIQTVMFAMMLPMFNVFASAPQESAAGGLWQALKRVFSGRGRQLAAVFFVMLLLRLCRAPNIKFYHSIYTDYFLGVVFFYCTMLAWRDDENNVYRALVLALGFTTLLLTKQTGIMLLPLVFALYVVRLALFDARGASAGNCTRMFAAACAAAAASVLLWYSFTVFADVHVSYCEKAPGLCLDGGGNIQSYSGFRVARAIDAFKSAGSSSIELLDEYRKAFAKAIFSRVVLRPLPFVPAVAIISLLVFVLVRGMDDMEQRRKVRLGGYFIIACALAYTVQMYLLYPVAFPVGKYVRLASYSRYMATMLLPIMLFAIYMYYESCARKKHILACSKRIPANCWKLVALSACLLFFTSTVFLPVLRGSWTHDRRDIAGPKYVASRLAATVPENARTYVINREKQYTVFQVALAYYTSPRALDVGNIGPHVDANQKVSIDLAPAQLHKLLRSYDYLYFVELDKLFIDKYSGIFERPELLKNDTIYKITATEGGMIALGTAVMPARGEEAALPLQDAAAVLRR